MMSKKWEAIINSLYVTKKENVDAEKLRHMLDYDFVEVSAEVLDNLYMMELLSLDEYKDRMARYIHHLRELVKFAEDELKTAEEKGDTYNPIIFYSLTRNDRSFVSSIGVNDSFSEWLNERSGGKGEGD